MYLSGEVMKETNKEKRDYKLHKLVLLVLLAVLFIAVYTFILQRNYSRSTLDATVERNVSRSDAIYSAISNKLTKSQYTDINTVEDMQKQEYKDLQKQLNELRKLEFTRYLYTAKRNTEGQIVYLVDGLDLSAEDFAYPGTLLEEEMIPYIDAALSGERIYSQEIMDTTWGHIFTACYPVYAPDNGHEIIGALCIEMDMESAYKTIEEANGVAVRIALWVALLAIILIACVYNEMQQQKKKDREMHRALEQAADAADAANKAKSTFLFNMSHDIRTPMNAILGYADLAREHLDEPEKLKHYMQNISVSGEKLLSIINNVLELARIENDTAEIEEKVLRAGEVFDSCNVMLKTALDEKHQKMTIEKNVRYPYIYIDDAHVSEIYLNIISNAIKYTGEGGHIKCTLNQLPDEREGWCITEAIFEDNGIGMSEEFQQHIFEAFSRERSSTLSGVDGTGLGMGIVKKLVDLMGGTIEVESTLGVGSKFTVRIPCRIAEESEVQAKEMRYHLDQMSIAGKRILMAEDNDLNAEIATELLEKEGLLIERVSDGAACIRKLEEAEAGYYDLILMDIQMPVMDGYQAARAIRQMSDQEKAKIPIVAVTANAFEEDREKAMSIGMNDHISKPINMNALILVFQRLLNAGVISRHIDADDET